MKEIVKRQQIIIPYKEVMVNTYTDPDTGKVIEYISSNYPDITLNVQKINEETGVPQFKIPQLIKKASNLTFPQYLNSIRFTEAKRLLTETSIPIIEVALNVGYNTVSHFNRIFKKIEDCSPMEYRKTVN